MPEAQEFATKPEIALRRMRTAISAGVTPGIVPADAYHEITWREGSKASLSSRFATLRVRPAHRDIRRSELRAEGQNRRVATLRRIRFCLSD